MAAQAPPEAGGRIQDGFKLFVVGDLIEAIPIANTIKRLSPSLVSLLESTDVGYGNFEGTAIDWHRYHGAPQAQSGGNWLISTPAVPADLRSLGFDLVSRANNHGTDWGVAGMLLTDRLLDEAGIAHAGSGVRESAARAPAFFDSPKGRIALVSTASSFVPMSRPADGRGVIPPRPGVSVLDTRETVFVSPARLAELRNLSEMLARAVGMPPPKAAARISLGGNMRFAADPKLSNQVRISYQMGQTDLNAILLAIRQAKETAGLVIVALHAHQPSNYSNIPPDFLPIFAHDCIDAGADVIAVSGPHRLRGIEIYKGKPIFYSLGNFVFTEGEMQPEPLDEFRTAKLSPATATDFEALEKKRLKYFDHGRIWYESVLPIITYRNGRAREIKLYPLQLGFQDSAVRRGVPRLADRDSGTRILARLAQLSKPFGTMIESRDGVGLIDLP
ncbi:MAG: CapA family protein [Steroidobacteraceae bacterium]